MYKFKKIRIILLMIVVSLMMTSCAIKNGFINEVSGTIISSQTKSILTEKGLVLRKSYNFLGSLSGFYLEDEEDKLLNIKVGDYVALNINESTIQVDRKSDGSSTLYKFDKEREHLLKKTILRESNTVKKDVIIKKEKIQEKVIIKKNDTNSWR